MFEPIRMNESASDLCWYPLYSPTCTDSDLLISTERLNLGNTIMNRSHELQNMSQISNRRNVQETESSSKPRQMDSSHSNVNEFIISAQTYKYQRKLSDIGTNSVGGIS